MADRSWMLNPSAIKAAKDCILVIERELGVKLKLSHPQFVQMIKDYSELTDSQELVKAYDKLMTYFGGTSHHEENAVEKLVVGGGVIGKMFGNHGGPKGANVLPIEARARVQAVKLAQNDA